MTGPGQRIVRSREGKDVVMDCTILAAPFDGESLLAAYAVLRERPVTEARPLEGAALFQRVEDADGVQRQEAVASGEHAHRGASFEPRPWRYNPRPSKLESPPSMRGLDRPRVRFGSRTKLHAVTVGSISRWCQALQRIPDLIVGEG